MPAAARVRRSRASRATGRRSSTRSAGVARAGPGPAPSRPRPRGSSAGRWSPGRRAGAAVMWAISCTALVEGLLVGGRRLGRAADLAHELQRGVVDLVRGRRRLEVVQRADVAAHGVEPTPDAPGSQRAGTAPSRRPPAPPGRRRAAPCGRRRRRCRRRPATSRSCSVPSPIVSTDTHAGVPPYPVADDGQQRAGWSGSQVTWCGCIPAWATGRRGSDGARARGWARSLMSNRVALRAADDRSKRRRLRRDARPSRPRHRRRDGASAGPTMTARRGLARDRGPGAARPGGGTTTSRAGAVHPAPAARPGR